MDAIKVGKAIAYLRKRAGFTQMDLANRIGVSDKAVSKWERGLGLPDISLLGKLSILLDTDTESLLAGDIIHHDPSWCGYININNSGDVNYMTMIHDKPLIDYFLSYFLLVGIKNIVILCNNEEEEYLKNRFGSGQEYGIKLTLFVGSHTDILGTHLFDSYSNIMMLYGRSFIYGVDQTRFFQRAMVNKDRATILGLTRTGSHDNRLIYDEEHKVVSESNMFTQYNTVPSSILFLKKEHLLQLKQNPVLLITELIKRQELYVEILDRGFIDIDINSMQDVQEVSTLVQIIEKACDMKIYDLKEIAWRRGLSTI